MLICFIALTSLIVYYKIMLGTINFNSTFLYVVRITFIVLNNCSMVEQWCLRGLNPSNCVTAIRAYTYITYDTQCEDDSGVGGGTAIVF